MNDAITLFVVEGESRDTRFIDEMTRCFMRGKYKIEIVNVPAAQNIYMLYNKLASDDFDTDIVEVLRENVPEARRKLEGIPRRVVAEVYLFFDFDPHQRNLVGKEACPSEAIAEMLSVFDNETENGKLYISYPMVEALYDYRSGQCQAFSRCYVGLDKSKDYKRLSGEGNPNSGGHMQFPQWKDALEVFAVRVRCLLALDNLDYWAYRQRVTPKSIFEAEQAIVEREGCVFVLSAFPEFLLDYFKQDFWNSRIRMTRFKFDKCPKR